MSAELARETFTTSLSEKKPKMIRKNQQEMKAKAKKIKKKHQKSLPKLSNSFPALAKE